jgi:hypothetical protein
MVRHGDPMTDDMTRWSLPDSEICSAAMNLARDVSADFLLNHCVRSFLFGRELAAVGGLRGGTDYDEELVFLACLLHDLGITDYGEGEERFEVDGADAAVRFLHEHGVPDERTAPVWQAIALHTSVGLAHRFGAISAVSFAGISFDINGVGRDALGTDFVDRVHASWPRHDLGHAIAELIARGTKADPRKAPPFSFPAHIHDLLNGVRLTFWDIVDGAPWGDQPLRSPR